MRFSTMNALVGGGIQRRQKTAPTVTASTATSVRQTILQILEKKVPADGIPKVTCRENMNLRASILQWSVALHIGLPRKAMQVPVD
jgi:hypothetical protein